MSGGGRAFSFLGVGGSLSVCGGGRLGSVVADRGRRGDEERHSFHPACRECSHKLFFSCLFSQKSQVSIGLMFLSPPWCHRGSGTQKDLQCWSSPGLSQMTAPQLGVLMERTECQRRNGHRPWLLSPSPCLALCPAPCPSPVLSLFLGLLLHSFPQGYLPGLPSPSERSCLGAGLVWEYWLDCLKEKEMYKMDE